MTQDEALQIMKAGHNVFLTGPAGSGKTFVLDKFIGHLRVNGIGVGITASTGVAATHIGGVTIHSWSGLGIKGSISDSDLKSLRTKSYLKKRFKTSDVLIIDEVSMLSSGQLDSIDLICREFKDWNLPFGGMQLVLSGDFFQLPPIEKDGNENNFVMFSNAWEKAKIKICYLEEQHRQESGGLLTLLSHIRNNNALEAEEMISMMDFNEVAFADLPTRLYTHNMDVDAINNSELQKVKGEVRTFDMSYSGNHNIAESLKKGCLAPEKLVLKVGAKVMFVKNNFDLGYVNGTVGEVIEFGPENLPVVKTLDGRVIKADYATWIVEEDEQIKAQIKQVPLRLAWAVTVHKSQGMNLDAAEIDLSKCFVEGMGYVALSRLRTLEGLKLKGVNKMAFRVNQKIVELDAKLREMSDYAQAELWKEQIENPPEEPQASNPPSPRKRKKATAGKVKNNQCKICLRPISHKGNCLACNIKLKKQRI